MKRLLAVLLCLAVLCAVGCGETPGNVESTDGSASDTTETTGEDIPGSVTPPAVQAWYPMQNAMTDTPTRVLFLDGGLCYYNKMDGNRYVFCFDPLCTHGEECISRHFWPAITSSGYQNIEYSTYNGRIYTLRDQKIYSFRSDGSDIRLECSFGEGGDWDDDESYFSTESIRMMGFYENYLYVVNFTAQDGSIRRALVRYDMDSGETKTLEMDDSLYFQDYLIGEDSLYVAVWGLDGREWYRVSFDFATVERMEGDMPEKSAGIDSLFDGNTLYLVSEIYETDVGNGLMTRVFSSIERYDFASGEYQVLFEQNDGARLQLLAMTEDSIYFTREEPRYLGTYTGRGGETVYTNDYSRIYRMDRNGENLTIIMDDISCEVTGVFLLDSKILIDGNYCREIENSSSCKRNAFMIAELDDAGMVTSVGRLN